jgi:hypothetical protein
LRVAKLPNEMQRPSRVSIMKDRRPDRRRSTQVIRSLPQFTWIAYALLALPVHCRTWASNAHHLRPTRPRHPFSRGAYIYASAFWHDRAIGLERVVNRYAL